MGVVGRWNSIPCTASKKDGDLREAPSEARAPRHAFSHACWAGRGRSRTASPVEAVQVTMRGAPTTPREDGPGTSVAARIWSRLSPKRAGGRRHLDEEVGILVFMFVLVLVLVLVFVVVFIIGWSAGTTGTVVSGGSRSRSGSRSGSTSPRGDRVARSERSPSEPGRGSRDGCDGGGGGGGGYLRDRGERVLDFP